MPARRSTKPIRRSTKPVPRSANRFNEREVARAIRAARKAGESEARVEIDPGTGKITVFLAKPGEAEAAPERIISKL
jgi:hypothetical protein